MTGILNILFKFAPLGKSFCLTCSLAARATSGRIKVSPAKSARA